MKPTSPQTLRRLIPRIAEDLKSQIQAGTFPPGARMPSVRQLARDRKISPSSAAEIYNALVAASMLEARAGNGYFVPNRKPANATVRGPEFPADSIWERRRESIGREVQLDAGCGWLPKEWSHAEGVRIALRTLARKPEMYSEGYGNPLGLWELRAHVSKSLESRGISATEEQIVLTQGASQALDLVVRENLDRGDTAIVEDPGYPPLFELLRSRGVQMLAVPRKQDGPDTDALEVLLKGAPVKCLFTNTAFHNPTGTTTTSATAHRMLELANRYAVTIVEDDSFADLAPRPENSLASLDGLHRVIYISSFSKTLSPALRAGYVVATTDLAQKLAHAKVISSLGSSELLEQIVLQILTSGGFRRHLNRLHERLALTHMRVAQMFGARGVELEFHPDPGLFLWARLPSRESVGKLWRRALEDGVLLAPGELFRPDGRVATQWRFNIAQCDSQIMARFLDHIGSGN